MANLLTHTGKLTVWQLLKIYWQSTDRRRALWGYAALVVLTIAIVLAQLALTSWSSYFYNALQAYRWHDANYLLVVFFGIAFTYIALFVIRFYLWQLFGLNWRRWLTQQFITRWLQGRNYYYLENFDVATDNPDQRIQDDVGMLIASSLDLSINLISKESFYIYLD